MPVQVFRIAGLLPPEPSPAPGEQDVLNAYRAMSDGERRTLLAMLRGFAGQPAPVSHLPNGAPSLPPDQTAPGPEDVAELAQRLDEYGLRQLYDFARWQLSEQGQRRDSSSKRPAAESDDEARWRAYFKGLSPAEVETALTNLDALLGQAGVSSADVANQPPPAKAAPPNEAHQDKLF